MTQAEFEVKVRKGFANPFDHVVFSRNRAHVFERRLLVRKVAFDKPVSPEAEQRFHRQPAPMRTGFVDNRIRRNAGNSIFSRVWTGVVA